MEGPCFASIVLDQELFLDQCGLGKDVPETLGQGSERGSVGSGRDAVLAVLFVRYGDVDAVDLFLGQASEPTVALVAINVPAKDGQSQVVDQVQLTLAVLDIRRQRVVLLVVAEPLPVIGRVDDVGRAFSLQNQLDLRLARSPIGGGGMFLRRGH